MATIHFKQTELGTADGSTAANAISVATLNSRTNSPGDILVLNGTVTDTITVHDSGSAGNPITYRFADSSAKLSKAYWGTTTSAAIYATGKSYITIDGNSAGIIENTANGDALANQQQSHGIYTTGGSNIIVQNLTIQNIFVHTSGTSNPSGVTPYTTVGWKAEDASDLDMHGCTVSHAYSAIYWPKTASGTKSNFYCYNNTLSACSTSVVIAAAAGVIDNAQVYGNDITMGANWYEVPNANHIDGIHMWGLGGGSMTNTAIYANYIHGDGSAHSTGHIFHEGNTGTVLIYNNRLVGSTTKPAEGYINVAYNASANTSRIYNNTITGLGTGATGGNGIAIDPTNAAMTVYIANNIIKDVFVGIYEGGSSATLSSDYNDFYNFGYVGWRASGSATLAAWRTATSGDMNSVTTNPALGAGDKLASNILPGTSLSSYFTTDKEGDARSAWNMGMDEYSAGGGSPPTFASAAINAAGTQLSATWSESCTVGAGGSGGMVVTASGGAVTLTYASGSPGNPWLYNTSRVILQGETVSALGYTQPGNGIEATDDGVDMATFSGQAVTNNSVIALGKSRQVRRAAAVLCGGGF